MNSEADRSATSAVDTIELARALVRLDTANPPGNEALAADLIAGRLERLGVAVQRHSLAPGRDGLVARLNPGTASPALCLCGHLDTVPVGTQTWRDDPRSGAVSDGRLWGRGSTDMKGAVAAMVTAFERLAVEDYPGELVLALCASEETGCQGAARMAEELADVGALLIGEPTNNTLAIAHKGVLWLKLTATGRAAHGSMPHLGENAVEAMAAAVAQLRSLHFDIKPHPLLGSPTHNVGTISGGSATNIVPDRCECTLDIRLTPGLGADDALAAVRELIGPDIAVDTVLALDAVETDPDDAWIGHVFRRTAELGSPAKMPISVSYFTDASVLQPALNFPPVAIVGPGDPALAHQVDESCSVEAIWIASRLYERLARDWAAQSRNETQGEQR